MGLGKNDIILQWFEISLARVRSIASLPELSTSQELKCIPQSYQVFFSLSNKARHHVNMHEHWKLQFVAHIRLSKAAASNVFHHKNGNKTRDTIGIMVIVFLSHLSWLSIAETNTGNSQIKFPSSLNPLQWKYPSISCEPLSKRFQSAPQAVRVSREVDLIKTQIAALQALLRVMTTPARLLTYRACSYDVQHSSTSCARNGDKSFFQVYDQNSKIEELTFTRDYPLNFEWVIFKLRTITFSRHTDQYRYQYQLCIDEEIDFLSKAAEVSTATRWVMENEAVMLHFIFKFSHSIFFLVFLVWCLQVAKIMSPHWVASDTGDKCW